MNRCSKCGTEFEGKFCPECGERWQENKVCPQCGATLKNEAKFCVECGYSFVVKQAEAKAAEESAVSSAEVKNNRTEEKTGASAKSLNTDLISKIYGILKFVPVAVFALFSALSLLFYIAPVAVIKGGSFLGEVIPDESLGNLYQTAFGAEELADLRGVCLFLLIVTVLSLILTAITLNATFSAKQKFKKINVGKFELRLGELLNYVGFVIYLIAFIMGLVLNGQVGALDEGMGLIGGGACPALVIAFSLVFAIVSAGSIAGRILIGKAFPEIKTAEEEKLNEQEEEYNRQALVIGDKEKDEREEGGESTAARGEAVGLGGKPVGFAIRKFAKIRRPVGYLVFVLILAVYAAIITQMAPVPFIQGLGGMVIWIELALILFIVVLSFAVPVNLKSWTPAKILKKSGMGKPLAGAIIALLFTCGMLAPVIIYKNMYGIMLRRLVVMFALGAAVCICLILLAVASSKMGEMLVEHFYGSAKGNRLAAVSYDPVAAAEDMKNYKASKNSGGAKVSLKGNKLFIVTACLFLATLITATAVYPVYTNKFSAGYLSEMSVKNERTAIEAYLGTPDEIRDVSGKPVESYYDIEGDVYSYYYYSNNYLKLNERINELEKDMLEAEENLNLDRLESLSNQVEQLIKDNQNLEFQYIKVDFVRGFITEVSYDAKASLMELTPEKRADKIVLEQTSVFIGAGLRNAYARITYTDGSYKYTDLGNYYVEYDRELGMQRAEWSDDWGEYATTVNFVDKVNGTFNGLNWELKREDYTNVLRITGTGKIEKDYSETYPWQIYSGIVNQINIGNGVTEISSEAFKEYTALSRVIIGNGITAMRYGAFDNSCTATFYVNLPEQTWSSGWCGNGNVIWNSDGQRHVYAFDSAGGTTCNQITDYILTALPQPTRSGYHFMGWYDNSLYTGNPVVAPYSAKSDVTLYARWLSNEDYAQLKDGSSFEKAIILIAGEGVYSQITQSGQRLYFEFTPGESGYYNFTSSGSTDTVANLYRASNTSSNISSNDDGGVNNNFLIQYNLTAGQTYYLVVNVHSNGTGEFTVSVDRNM